MIKIRLELIQDKILGKELEAVNNRHVFLYSRMLSKSTAVAGFVYWKIESQWQGTLAPAHDVSVAL